VPEKMRWVIKLNPMYPFIELYHQVLLHHFISFPMLAYAFGLTLLCFLGSVLFFERSKYAFADVL
jgi:lipopolysaccharide transport system permease protein